MEYQYLLITFWVTLTVVQSHFDLPEIIYEVCPYSDICNRTATKSLNVEGWEPCCSSCKCDEKCGLRLDCCFDDMDKYHLKDNGIVACITPYTTNKTHRFHNRAYWMIKACKFETGDGFKTNEIIPCELYDQKGKYIVEPVSSKETGNIYVNEKCAICNNVYNFTKWNYLILTEHLQVGPYVWETKINNENHSDPSVYSPPEEEDWSIKRCSKSLGKCITNSTFEILCRTFNLPYITNMKTRLRNPFCLMCEPKDRISKECKDEPERINNGRFTVLIDYSVKASSKLRKNEMINKNLKPDCPKEFSVLSKQESCLPIYCPDGMLMTPTGCKYFIRRWYIPSFRIQFKLWTTAGNELPISTLNALTLDERNNPLLWMKIPCRQVKADIIEVAYEIVKDGQEIVESFIVALIKRTPGGIDPSVIFHILRKCLKYHWYIQILGKTYSFRPTLDKYSTYIQDGQTARINRIINEREHTNRPKLYERIPNPNSELKLGVPVITILKTFFCDQIILPMDAVEVLFGEILILSKNVTLGDNEFAVNFFMAQNENGHYTNDPNKTTFSVCLADYDTVYNRLRSGGTKPSRTFILEQLVILFVVS